eukprot:726496-Pyramimonas_sp.AAC.1
MRSQFGHDNSHRELVNRHLCDGRNKAPRMGPERLTRPPARTSATPNILGLRIALGATRKRRKLEA